MCANDVGRYGVELQLAFAVRQTLFSPAMGLLSLSDFETGNFFSRWQKKTASNVAGLPCSARYPAYSALPNVRYDRLKDCYDCQTQLNSFQKRMLGKKGTREAL